MDDLEKDDLEFRAEEFKKLTPVDYAKLKSIAPQRIYYYIRNGQLPFEYCQCGRKIISVEEADKLLREKSRTPLTVDARSDEERVRDA